MFKPINILGRTSLLYRHNYISGIFYTLAMCFFISTMINFVFIPILGILFLSWNLAFNQIAYFVGSLVATIVLLLISGFLMPSIK
jgi:hypothetical protein